jgi:hypothetical protein
MNRPFLTHTASSDQNTIVAVPAGTVKVVGGQ